VLQNGQALPAWLSFEPKSKKFYGKPSNSDVGLIRVCISAKDMVGASANYSFEIEVQNVNDPPALQTEINDIVTTEDENLFFGINNKTFNDIDINDSLVYRATLANKKQLPNWLNFDPENLIFSGIPLNENVGKYEIILIATDTYKEMANDTFSILVMNSNDCPELLIPLKDRELLINTEFYLQVPSGTFIDIDDKDQIELRANLHDGSILPAWLNFNPEQGLFSGIPQYEGEYRIKLLAKDKSGMSVSDEFKLLVYSNSEFEKLLDKKITLYPNPSNGLLYIKIELDQNINKWEIRIKDLNGKTLIAKELIHPKSEIDLSTLPKSAYIVEIHSKNFISSKIIIMK
jgi:hypothetical protein